MIIVLKNANFSQSNIGTLSSWRISRSLGAGATYDGPISVDKGAALSATINITDGYELGTAGITITMGGIVLNGAVSGPLSAKDTGVDYTISIASVTGNVLIKVPTVNTSTGEEEEPEEPDTPVTNAVVNLNLTDSSSGILYNIGTGGSAYSATLNTPKTGDSYSTNANGLTLVNHAYASVPYGFKASDNFTIFVKGSIPVKSDKRYQRLMRTDTDAPSVYYGGTSYNYNVGAKLAGVANTSGIVHVDGAIFKGVGGSPLNTCYVNEDYLSITDTHRYVWVGNGTKIYYYIDGVLVGSQDQKDLETSASIGLGDNDTNTEYYGTNTVVNAFHIYDYAMTAEEVAALV